MVDNSCIIEGNVKFRDGKKVSLRSSSAACSILACYPPIPRMRCDAIRCVQRVRKNRVRARARAPFSFSPCDNHASASSQFRESCPRRPSTGVLRLSFVSQISSEARTRDARRPESPNSSRSR